MVTYSSGTGGSLLRQIRQRAGLAQLAVEAAAELGSGYMQRIESGRVTQPARSTLERILDALAATYADQRAVLAAYGYTLPTPLPTEADICRAQAQCQPDLEQAQVPCYLLDCAHRLLAWNVLLPRLLGLASDSATLEPYRGQSLLAAWFDPGSPFGALICEPDEFYPLVIQALRHEYALSGHEPWYDALLTALQRERPLFQHYWMTHPAEPHATAARTRRPIRLSTAGEVLTLWLTAEPLTSDPRFRLMSWLPADATTTQQVARWVAE